MTDWGISQMAESPSSLRPACNVKEFRKFMLIGNLPGRTKGFTLVELMVALVLGIVLVAGILQLFLASRQTFTTNESLARVQENVRFSLEEIKGGLRGASHFAFCGTRPEPQSHLNLPSLDWVAAVFGPQTTFIGWEFVGTGLNGDHTIDPAFPTAAASAWISRPRQANGTAPNLNLPAVLSSSAAVRPVAGSDVIIVRRMVPVPGVTATGTSAASGAEIQLDGPHGLAQGDLVMVTDCTNADYFRNTSSNANQLNRSAGSGGCGACPNNRPPAGAWDTLIDQTLQVYRVELFAYFVGFSNQLNRPGLYRLDLSTCNCGSGANELVELVEGVENMQVLLGYSLPGSQGGDGKTVAAGNWLTANQFSDWWPIIGARVAMLYRSPDAAGVDALQQTFNLIGAEITAPEDTRLRQEATVTVAFRNRVMFDD